MFSVYGKSKQVAKKQVDKLLSSKISDISVQLREMKGASQSEKQEVVNKLIEDTFEAMKPKRCTHEFSTPEIAAEAYQIMIKDSDNFSDLIVMKKRPKKNASGGVVVSKATKKPLMEWVPLYEEEQDKRAA